MAEQSIYRVLHFGSLMGSGVLLLGVGGGVSQALFGTQRDKSPSRPRIRHGYWTQFYSILPSSGAVPLGK